MSDNSNEFASLLGFWKKWYTYTVPICLVLFATDEVTSKQSWFYGALGNLIGAGKAEMYYLYRGGSPFEKGTTGQDRNGKRGPQSYETMLLGVYDQEEGQNLALKTFMTDHVTRWEPAIFSGLVSDWEAVQKWGLYNSDTMIQAFGEEQIDVISYMSTGYAITAQLEFERDYYSYEAFMEKLATRKSFDHIYKTKGGQQGGKMHTLILNQDIPESLAADISEPNVTAQLLEHVDTTMNIFEKGVKSVTRYEDHDTLNCVVSGQQTWYTVSAFQRQLMRPGLQMRNGDNLGPQFSGIDLADEDWKETRVHMATLSAGDCMYVPGYWFFQTEVGLETPSTTTVRFDYEMSSPWAAIMWDGMEEQII